MKTDSPIKQLIRIVDCVSEPILTMTDEEIRAEIIEDGQDPDEVAARVRQMMLDTVAKYKGESNGD